MKEKIKKVVFLKYDSKEKHYLMYCLCSSVFYTFVIYVLCYLVGALL